MSEISDAIQAKCLAFGDRIIKLNDYLLEQASQKYDAGRQKYGMRKGKSSFSHQTSDLSQPSSLFPLPSNICCNSIRLQKGWINAEFGGFGGFKQEVYEVNLTELLLLSGVELEEGWDTDGFVSWPIERNRIPLIFPLLKKKRINIWSRQYQ